jgi:hypothetical protein
MLVGSSFLKIENSKVQIFPVKNDRSPIQANNEIINENGNLLFILNFRISHHKKQFTYQILNPKTFLSY